MTIERRIFTTEFREVPGSNRQRWAQAVAYNVVDDFGTIWNPGVFNEALDQRMPTLLYGHDWTSLAHVLGKGIDYRETDTGVDVLLEFDDPEFVPLARQAMWQVEHKTLRDVSVGFERREWVKRENLTQPDRSAGAAERMMKAGMDELSCVIRGAVPGAAFRSVRSVGGAVDLDAVLALGRQVAAGDLSHDEAKAALALLADDEPAAAAGGAGGAGDEEQGQEGDEQTPEEIAAALEVDDALSAADEAMLLLERSR